MHTQVIAMRMYTLYLYARSAHMNTYMTRPVYIYIQYNAAVYIYVLLCYIYTYICTHVSIQSLSLYAHTQLQQYIYI